MSDDADPGGHIAKWQARQSVRREFVGFIWIEDQPGIPLSIWATSPQEARGIVDARYGTGPEHIVTLWNEVDARTPR
jgi:hypothetical protein